MSFRMMPYLKPWEKGWCIKRNGSYFSKFRGNQILWDSSKIGAARWPENEKGFTIYMLDKIQEDGHHNDAELVFE